MKYKATCSCGSVEIELDNDPFQQLVCHCNNCRGWSAAPVTSATLFQPEEVRITKGSEHVKRYEQNEGHEKCWCDKCGGHLMNDHTKGYGFKDVYGALIQNFSFTPTAHINYGNSILKIKDGLPKFKDFPSDFGGSGELLEE
jgi:hypothetical protein|tara:strand:- start:421 stop:846 length:426 start_codon:yes stop_codon:yes gene_type:complete